MSGLQPTRTDDVLETYHGDPVADPYRWLEDEEGEEQRAWTRGRDEWCREQLAQVDGREVIAERILELARIGGVGMPNLKGGKLFFQQRTGEQDHAVLLVRDTISGEGRVLLDPNDWSEDSTVALDWWTPSKDGSRLAFGTSEGGSEISTLQVLHVDGSPSPPVSIPRCRASAVEWLSDHSGFYYTRSAREGEVPEEELPYHRHVYFHDLSSAPDGSDDRCVFGPGLPFEQWTSITLSPNDRWLVVIAVDGWSRSDLYLLDTEDLDAPAVELVKGRDALFFARAHDDYLWIQSNEGAPRNELLRAEWGAPTHADWEVVVPESEAVIEWFALAKGRLVLRELKDAAYGLRVLTQDGSIERELAMPELGTVSGVGAEHDSEQLVFSFTSFTIPSTLYSVDLSTEEDPGELLSVSVGAPDPARFVVEQVWYPSKDGTEIPMFVTRRADLPLDGSQKTLLYGYGGFDVSLTPVFQSNILAWVERGGVYALANLRGGGEYGESWHAAGMLGEKQNCFDDFAAAGDWLVEKGWAARERLAVYGGSNGGLLTLVTATQRPDLCRAVVSSVPLADMLRYHLFQIARLWIPEYGCSEDEEQYGWLKAYSPYHNVVEGTEYPAVLIMTGEGDTRVDPLHARKMAARLEASTGSDHPVLLRVERKAGHGQGMPLKKAIEVQVDLHCFLEWQLDG